MKTKTISQTVIITSASPHELYEIFMDEKKHAKLVNSTAKISRKIGEGFEIYDGYIDGTNIELIQDKKIVQNWRGNSAYTRLASPVANTTVSASMVRIVPFVSLAITCLAPISITT